MKQLPAGTPIALKSSGHWYWLVRGMEEAGLDARLAHALKAKRRMPGRNQSDHLDARGLALKLRNGSLAEVWIPPASQLAGFAGLDAHSIGNTTTSSQLKGRILAALRRHGVRRY